MTTTENDFDEIRVMEAAEYVRQKLGQYIEDNRVDFFKDCRVHENGLTLGEIELGIIRALGLLVLDGTQRMFRFKSEVETDDELEV